jgi:hypothetical protein
MGSPEPVRRRRERLAARVARISNRWAGFLTRFHALELSENAILLTFAVAIPAAVISGR